MTEEQLTRAKWIKEEIRIAEFLRRDIGKCDHIHVVVHMPPKNGSIDKPLHVLPGSMTNVFALALRNYIEQLNKEFENL